MEIIPGLWLGSSSDTADYVIDCQLERPPERESTVIHIPFSDIPTLQTQIRLIQRLPIITRQIDQTLKRGIPVMVRCRWGSQRSATIVAAYLIRYHQMTVNEAIKYIQKRRWIAFRPYPFFYRVLALM